MVFWLSQQLWCKEYKCRWSIKMENGKEKSIFCFCTMGHTSLMIICFFHGRDGQYGHKDI